MKVKKIIYIFFIAALIALAGLAGYKTYQEAKRSRQIESEMKKLEEEAAKITSDNLNLEDKIAYFKTEEYQESEAKKRLNYQKPDENVVIIKPSISHDESPKEEGRQPEAERKEELPNYKKWWNYFFRY